MQISQSQEVFQNRDLQREVKTGFLALVKEQYPELRKVKCKINACYKYIILRAKYQNRSLYVKTWNGYDYLERFLYEYQTKVRMCEM